LTEVIIASTLLVFAMVPILKALTIAQVTNTVIEHRTCSLILAQAKLDEIRARSIHDYAGTVATTSASLDGPYLCTVTDTVESTNLRKITVAVGYDLNADGSLGADEIQIRLATLMARRW
jgi:Tfp pilus assembly protein PilV